MDVSVKRGAECNSDHQLLRVKLRVSLGRRQCCTVRKSGVKRFNVEKLKGRSVDDDGQNTPRGLFQEQVCTVAREKWNDSETIEEKWSVLRSTLTDVAQAVLGKEVRHQPDWYRESTDVIEPLIKRRNQLYAKWLRSDRVTDKQAFKKARCDTRRTIRNAKEQWFLMKAQEAEKNRFSGKSIWRSIRDMQSGRRGIVPMRSTAIRDENGNPCSTLEDQQERWRRHFASILNTQSQFDHTEIENRDRFVAELPSREELEEAIGKLKNGKAGGKSDILPEMVRAACCEEEFLEMLLELIHQAWKEGRVPKDWVDAVLIPIPKKGDHTRCDNWRGISLLDVVGKLVAPCTTRKTSTASRGGAP